jgi:hypothetical protein
MKRITFVSSALMFNYLEKKAVKEYELLPEIFYMECVTYSKDRESNVKYIKFTCMLYDTFYKSKIKLDEEDSTLAIADNLVEDFPNLKFYEGELEIL